MNPLRELKNLVSNAAAVESGIVTSVQTAAITVRGRSGLKSFSISVSGQYKPGDTVRYQGNVLLGRAINVESIPVFKV